jgi:aspartyl-tRNA(Asn)/glutamyl-tRNA(Gln) amidotransferase subunit A
VERSIAALAELAARTPTMNLLVCDDLVRTRAEAAEATSRFAAGVSLGPLDGVPFLVKDEFDVEGLRTRLGSRCGADEPAVEDSTVVARLQRAGGIFLGKTVLTEWGMSPIGGNIGAVVPRNAHHASRAPGGSSTGSAVGVAMGIVPLAAGGDGGGSIRIPAALNGVLGIKPTFGRVSRAGDGFKGSVAHAGPIANSTLDLAHFLDAVASEVDPRDELTSGAPPPPEGGFGKMMGWGVRGLRVGVDAEAWSHASHEVARAGTAALQALEREGAVLVPITMPLAKYAAQIGYLTIGPESLVSHRDEWLYHRERIGDDVRLTFAVLAGFSALDQLDAQYLRAGLRQEAAEVLREVDVLALPTTAITAPEYADVDAREGFSDPAAMDGLCRFAFLGNLTGLPAGTAPVGVDSQGLPIGLQIIGDAWDEAAVLAVLAHLERSAIAVVPRPPAGVDLFEG